MVPIDLFGWMVLWNVSLDSLVFIQIVMAGMCVTTFICIYFEMLQRVACRFVVCFGFDVFIVGLTVDYCIHISHALVYAKPNDPRDFHERVRLAMTEMGVGVTKGAWTTFIGCFVLIFSTSAAFRTFFYMFSGVIIIALTHGLLLVPSIVSELQCCLIRFDEDDSQTGSSEPKTTGMTRMGTQSVETGTPRIDSVGTESGTKN